MSDHLSPLGGTATMTACQLAVAKATGTEMPSAAGVVARRIAEGVLVQKVPEERTPALNQAMHRTYGAAWGGVYGLAQGTLRLPAPHHGVLFGLLVGTAGTAELTALGLTPPPWETPPSTLAMNAVFHLVYGLTTADTFYALSR